MTKVEAMFRGLVQEETDHLVSDLLGFGWDNYGMFHANLAPSSTAAGLLWINVTKNMENSKRKKREKGEIERC